MRIVDGQAGAIIETQVAALPTVREWNEAMPVSLWINRAGRLVLKACNEDGHNSTEVDVFDLIEWFKRENEVVGDSTISAIISATSADGPDMRCG